MRGVPVGIPLVWTDAWAFVLQSGRFGVEIGRDCQRHLEFIR